MPARPVVVALAWPSRLSDDVVHARALSMFGNPFRSGTFAELLELLPHASRFGNREDGVADTSGERRATFQ